MLAFPLNKNQLCCKIKHYDLWDLLSVKKEWFPLLVIMKAEHCHSYTHIEEVIELANIKNMSHRDYVEK